MEIPMGLETAAETHFATRTSRHWLGYSSLVGLGCFVVTVILLHWLQPGLDSLNEAVSYYVHSSQGWLLTVGLLGLGIGSAALTAGLVRTLDGRRARAGQWLLAVWSAGVLLGGIFRADPQGNWDQPMSMAGMIHGSAALIAFLTLPIAALVLARTFRHDARWQRKATLLLTLAVATALQPGRFHGVPGAGPGLSGPTTAARAD